MYKQIYVCFFLLLSNLLFIRNLNAQHTSNYQNKITVRSQIIEKLDSVVDAGTRVQLPQTYFATLYNTMVGQIQLANQNGHFTDSLLIDYIQKNFTDYYLDALTRFKNNDSLSFAWQAALDTGVCHNCTYVQWLALGTNAHINHDLYLILLDYFKQNGTAGHHPAKTQKEFFAISARETDRIVKLFIKADPNISWLEGILIKSGTNRVKKQIKKYLKNTWANAMEAAAHPTDEATITQKQLAFALHNANAFLHAGFPIKSGFKMLAGLDALSFETKLGMLAPAAK